MATTTYGMADDDVLTLVAKTLHQHHYELAECGLRVGVLMALNPDGPAIKVYGNAAVACVRVVSLKDRLTKGFDCEILIDEHIYLEELTDRQREAVIDHELSHVVRVPNTPKAIAAGEARWKTDDLGRPKVKLRKGDWNCGDGFSDVIARHGDSAVEFRNIRDAMTMANKAKASGKNQPKPEVDPNPTLTTLPMMYDDVEDNEPQTEVA